METEPYTLEEFDATFVSFFTLLRKMRATVEALDLAEKFHAVAVKERDYERACVHRLTSERDEALRALKVAEDNCYAEGCEREEAVKQRDEACRVLGMRAGGEVTALLDELDEARALLKRCEEWMDANVPTDGVGLGKKRALLADLRGTIDKVLPR